MEKPSPFRILLIDDDALGLASTQMLLESEGYRVDTAISGVEALKRIVSASSDYALVLLDYRLKGEDGASVAEKLLEVDEDLTILIYSGDKSREALKETWRAGAVGFIEKSEDSAGFLIDIASWCNKYRETKKTIDLPSSLNANSDIIASIKMIGRSKQMAEVARQVHRYARKNETVLITGETGTGKERVARALHLGDPSKFFAVNCAAYAGSTELMESELFGYVRGAFTGANRDHTGVFEAANGGTIFLDEIHTLDRIGQQKLLRAIQERMIRKLGSNQEIAIHARVIVAAKPEIEVMVRRGEFLPDLFERLNVLRISISPLRERPEDIEPLVAYFCANFERETGEKKSFLYRTVRYLESYAWPRNVRELENTVRRLCIDVREHKITPDHLDGKFFRNEPSVRTPLKDERDELIRERIETALSSSSSQREAAKKLQMPESSLRRLMKKMDIRVQS